MATHREQLRCKEEELRVQQAVLDDVSCQLERTKASLKETQEAAAVVAAQREAAEREGAASREARDALRVSEANIERLERALDDLESARAEATAEAEAAKHEVAHKEGMLTFVEREVHSVKALFAEQEEALRTQMRQRIDESESAAREAQRTVLEAEEMASKQRALAEKEGQLRSEAEAAVAAGRAERDQMAEQLWARSDELSRMQTDKERIEGEMRLVLRAMDQQKQIASRNMAQLSQMYSEWNSSVNA